MMLGFAHNDNYQPKNIKISATGENAYFSKLPIYQIQVAIQVQCIPTYISKYRLVYTFLCKYHLLEILSKEYPK